MENGIGRKNRIVWLCHFANKEMKDYFNTPKVNEMAPWMNSLIQLFKFNSSIELFIVAPNVFTNKSTVFNKDGITYYFYNRIPIIGQNKFLKRIYTFFKIEQVTNFYWTNIRIHKNIKRIKPDLIHLHGAENPYYSSAITKFIKDYPVLTTIQGFIRNTSINNINIRKRKNIENEILEKCMHFGVRTEEMSREIIKLNPDATLHFHQYPIEIPSVIKENIGKEEPIDCLFFAKVSKDKGIEDLLEVISIVKSKIESIRLLVIGGCNIQYLNYLKTICAELQIESNVQFLGFLDTQEEIYKYAEKSKMCVLPTHYDIIPGTIIESMLMKLPVIAYSVGGIPELNSKGETVVLVEKGSVKEFAERILLLLRQPQMRRALAEKAYNLAQERYNKGYEIKHDILKAYNSILGEK